jgi:hypothetical protein
MKLKPLRLAFMSAVAYVAANPKARARAGHLAQEVREKVEKMRGRSSTPPDVAPYLTTSGGDVESEDPGGSWADDGGGGIGGGQRPDVGTTS